MQSLIAIMIFGVAILPLVITQTIAGGTAEKIFVFRVLIEGAVFIYCLGFLRGKETERGREMRKILKHPVTITLLLFLISAIISAIFSKNPYRAFWGDLGRGEGVFGMIHYFVLFLIVAGYFTLKKRVTLLKCFLVAGYVLIFYSLATQNGPDRVQSYIGNAAFFASHLLFLIAVAWVVLKESQQKTLWWYLGAAMMPLAAIMIMMTKTRGAIIGLGVGLVVAGFLYAKKKLGRKVMWVLGVVCVLGAAYVFSLGKIPSFVGGQRSGSIYTRLAMWEAGWEAFQDRPFIGWGPEHFILASSEHYNPKAARFGETWFDRAHNKIVDVLVAQGAVGGIIFLGLMGSVLWAIRNDKTYKKPLVFAFGSAYFAQAMFAPDQVVSWIGLMVFLGVIVGERSADPVRSSLPNRGTGPRFIGRAGAVGAGAIAVIAFYYGNALPYAQLRVFSEARRAKDPTLLLEKAFASNTFVRAEAATNVINFYLKNQPDLITHPKIGEIIRDGLKKIKEKEGQNIQYRIQYVLVLLEQAKQNNALYSEAEQELEALLKIAPKRQEIYYLLAFTLGLEERAEEAIGVAERAVLLDPEVARAHYVLGAALAFSGSPETQKRAEEEFAKAEELNPSLDTLYPSDLNTLIQIYKSKKRWDRLAGIALRNAEGVISWTTLDEQTFVEALFHFAEEKNKEAFIKIGKYIESQFPKMAEEARGAIELVEQGEWEAVQSMFELE